MPETERQVPLSQYKEKLDVVRINTARLSVAHLRASFTRLAATGYLTYEASQQYSEGMTGKAVGLTIAALVALKFTDMARREYVRYRKQWSELRDEKELIEPQEFGKYSTSAFQNYSER